MDDGRSDGQSRGRMGIMRGGVEMGMWEEG